MKKFWFAVIALLLLFGFSFAWSQQTTPNLGLVVQTPPPMPNNWSAIINYDLWKIDGAALDYTNLYQGAWSSTTTYKKSMMVTHSGTLYVSAINGNLNLTPGVSGSWIAAGGGGTLPSGSATQILYYAADGTTLTPTSSVVVDETPVSGGVFLEANNNDRSAGFDAGLFGTYSSSMGATRAHIQFQTDEDSNSSDVNNTSYIKFHAIGGSTTNAGTGHIELTAEGDGTGHDSGSVMLNSQGSQSLAGNIELTAHNGDPTGGKVTVVSSGAATFVSSNWSLDSSGNVTFHGTGCSSGAYVKGDGTGCGTPNLSIDVNGSPVNGTPNFNATTPAAPAGATNQTYQADGSGNISSYDYSVQYGPPATNYIFASDSRFIVDGTNACQNAGNYQTNITSYSITSDVGTFNYSATVTPTAGNVLKLALFGTSTFLNGVDVTVLAGVTSGTFTGNITHANVGLTTESGIGSCAGSVPNQASTQPFLSNHGTVINSSQAGGTIATLASAYTASVHPYVAASVAAGAPAYVFVMPTVNEWSGSCPTLATLETAYLNYFSSVHTDGGTVVGVTGTDWQFNTGFCPSAFYQWATLNDWLRAQGKGVGNTASGRYWDYLVDGGSSLTYAFDSNFYMQSGPFISHFTSSGASLMANLIGQAVAAKGPAVGTDLVGRRTMVGPLLLTGTTSSGGTLGASLTMSDQTTGASLAWAEFNSSGTGYPYESYSGSFADSFHTLTGGIARVLTPTSAIGWNAGGGGAAPVTGAADTLLYRDSAGVVGVGTNAIGTANGSLKVANLTVSGTCTGCSTSPTFSLLAGGTNTTAAMIVGAGASLAPTSTGTIQATNIASTVAVSSPITVTGSGTTASPYTIACPTCGTSSGGTNVSQNSGAAEANLAVTGYMPQVCSDVSASGTVQSCSVANTFTPQAGNCVVYKTTTANSGTGLTVNINSLGAKSVAVASSSGWTTTLTASFSIPANKPMNLCYDGTNWDASGTGYTPSTAISAFPFTILQKSQGFSSNNTTSIVVTYPQALQASGATAYVVIGTGGTVTTPTGWTLAATTGSANFVNVYSKTSDGTSSVTFTQTTGSDSWIFFELSGTRTLDTSSTSTLLFPAITPTAGSMIISSGVYSGTVSSLWQPNNLDPNWGTISVGSTFTTGGRALLAYVYKTSATGTTIIPPPVDTGLLGGSIGNTLTFSIK